MAFGVSYPCGSERWILKSKSMDKDIRVGDAERHNALDLLSTHFANGLIDINEFEDRTEKAAVARTRGGLGISLEESFSLSPSDLPGL